MSIPENRETPLPPLTVEAMRRLCQEMMKNGHGDYIFRINPFILDDEQDTTITKAVKIDSEKTVELS